MTDIAQQIEELRAKRAQLEEQYNTERAERELQAALQREEWGLELDEAFMEAERTIGPAGIKIGMVLAPDGRGVIVRTPDFVYTKAFQAQCAKKDPTPSDIEAYARRCVYFPTREKYDAITKDFPLITSRIMALVQELGGATERKIAEK